MWLIDVKTFELKNFIGHDVWTENPYAILSHTWGEDEVTFQDMRDLELARQKAGFGKIEKTCKQAKSDDLELAWVDTCCIDKTSSTELQEAINSMFEWYAHATCCYALLSDVIADSDPDQFETSRWFSRGWTLQELIAPINVHFYDNDWVEIGSRNYLKERISKCTGIDEALLKKGFIDSFQPESSLLPWVERHGELSRRHLTRHSVAKRMSWASGRQTTRIEDLAYSMLGIFGIFMPLHYGEGKRSFVRLQEEIFRVSRDLSILAWDRPTENRVYRKVYDDEQCLFAESPDAFRSCGSFEFHETTNSFENAVDESINKVGIKITMPLVPLESGLHEPADWAGILNCFDSGDVTSVIAIKLVSRNQRVLPYYARMNVPSESRRRDRNAYALNDAQRGMLHLNAYSLNDAQSHLWDRIVRVDAFEAEQKAQTRPVVILREWVGTHDSDSHRHPSLSDNIPAIVWIRFSYHQFGPCWEAIEAYPESKWNVSTLTYLVPGRKDLLIRRVSWDSYSTPSGYAVGAIAFQRYDIENSRVALSFACQVHYGNYRGLPRFPQIWFRLDKLEPGSSITQGTLSDLCDKLLTENLPHKRPSAQAVHLYDRSWTYDASIFAVKSETRRLADRLAAILHVFELRSMDALPALDKRIDLPVNLRA